jgi:Uma2 family endonuclease
LRAAANGRAAIMRFSTDQYHAMLESGIVPEDSTIELLYGMLVRKDRAVLGEDPMGHSPLHGAVITLLSALIPRINSAGRHLQIQLPITIPPDHEPEPDAAVILGDPRSFFDHLPRPDDVASVIEVAHSSLERDIEEKATIYAAGGIPQYLVINLRERLVEELSEPDATAGRYLRRVSYSSGQSINLQLGNEQVLAVPVADLLP